MMKFFLNLLPLKNKEVFKIINDLLIPDLEQISEDIQITQNEINEKGTHVF